MKLLDCNLCENIEPNEIRQTNKKEPHMCLYHNRIVHHNRQHPRLPRPAWCDFWKEKGVKDE
jgi:hypothetical protein